jgi:hypothetical protein
MYVLQNQGSIKGPKWESRERVAVYLGPSMTDRLGVTSISC